MSDKHIAVVIPAFNEETRIVDTLGTLLETARPGEFDVTVVCNGCTDATARVARTAFPDAHVIELEEASKTTAINTGLQFVDAAKVILLDADIRIDTDACRDLAAALDKPGIDAAIGRMEINARRSSMPVRAFYKVWETHPYLSNGKFAAAFAMSKEAIDRIGVLPAVIADDTFICRNISRERVQLVEGVSFIADVPRKLSTLIRVRSRIHYGNLQLAGYVLEPAAWQSEKKLQFVRSVLAKPSLWAALPVYLLVAVAARVLAMRQQIDWQRDATTRCVVTD